MVATRELIAYVELAVYVPTLILNIFVVLRHGFKRQFGWIFLCIFCVIRLAGAGFEIASIKTPTSTTDKEWATILQAVGLSPLLLASLGLLKRVIDATSSRLPNPNGPNPAMQDFMARSRIAKRLGGKATAVSRRSRLIQLIQLPATIALILCISGGTDESNSNASKRSSGKTEVKAGMVMFLIIYVILFVLAIASMFEIRKSPKGERRIILGILVALPFIAVRLLWSILADFTNLSQFSTITGSIWVQVCMATVEEFIVVIIYTLLGLTVPKSDYSAPPDEELQDPRRQHAPQNPYNNQQPGYPAQYHQGGRGTTYAQLNEQRQGGNVPMNGGQYVQQQAPRSAHGRGPSFDGRQHQDKPGYYSMRAS